MNSCAPILSTNPPPWPSPKSTPGRDRTCDRRIRNPLLYPLSYGRLDGELNWYPGNGVEQVWRCKARWFCFTTERLLFGVFQSPFPLIYQPQCVFHPFTSRPERFFSSPFTCWPSPRFLFNPRFRCFFWPWGCFWSGSSGSRAAITATFPTGRSKPPAGFSSFWHGWGACRLKKARFGGRLTIAITISTRTSPRIFIR